VSRLAALQRKHRDCSLLRSSEPPWFLGTMWSTSRARWCSCAPQHSQRPLARVSTDFDRAADRGAVAAPVGEHLFAALLSEGIGALAAQLQHLVALGVAQLYCCAEAFGYAAHKVVGALVEAGDAVEGEPCPPSA
jgi:hypothetical protein